MIGLGSCTRFKRKALRFPRPMNASSASRNRRWGQERDRDLASVESSSLFEQARINVSQETSGASVRHFAADMPDTVRARLFIGKFRHEVHDANSTATVPIDRSVCRNS